MSLGHTVVPSYRLGALARTGIELECGGSEPSRVDAASQISRRNAAPCSPKVTGRFTLRTGIPSAVIPDLFVVHFRRFFLKWMSFIVAIAWTLAMRDTVNKSSFRRKHLEHLLTFEQKWSRLARELNDQYRHHEVTVEIVRDYVVKRGHCGIIGLLAHVRTVLGRRV